MWYSPSLVAWASLSPSRAERAHSHAWRNRGRGCARPDRVVRRRSAIVTRLDPARRRPRTDRALVARALADLPAAVPPTGSRVGHPRHGPRRLPPDRQLVESADDIPAGPLGTDCRQHRASQRARPDRAHRPRVRASARTSRRRSICRRWRTDGKARRLSDGAFETARAIQVGRRVAGEVLNNSPDGSECRRLYLGGLRRAVNGQRQPAAAAGTR